MRHTLIPQKPLRVCTTAMVALILSALPVKAWNNVGHRTIAELAWRQLDMQERHAVSELLKQHPHYQRLLLSDLPRNVDRDEWAFLTAAVWPDMVRPAKPGQPQKPSSITKYDLYPHAIGYPFVRAADSNSVSVENFYIAKPNAEMVLSNSIATLADKRASAHDRAVSLCWVLHLAGDLHQPLHTATWVRKDKSGWDGLGGNYIVIDARDRAHTQKIDLHSFWDRLAGADPSYKAVAALADKLVADPELKPGRMAEYKEHKTIAAWVQESYRLAVDFAYAEDRVKFVDADALLSGKIAESQIPTLRADYIAGAETIARRRFVLAAERLADVLRPIW